MSEQSARVGIPAVWFQGMAEEDKEAFAQYLRNSTQLLDRLTQVVKSHVETIEKRELDYDFYEKQNLVERIAFNNGQLAMCQKLLAVLTFRN